MGGLQREEQGHFPHTVNRNGELHVDPDHYGMALVSCFSAEYDLLFRLPVGPSELLCQPSLTLLNLGSFGNHAMSIAAVSGINKVRN